MLKINSFKSLQFFQGRIIWNTFGWGALGAEILCLSGVKICPWNTLGRNLGGQVENVCPLGAEKGQSLPSSALRRRGLHVNRTKFGYAGCYPNNVRICLSAFMFGLHVHTCDEPNIVLSERRRAGHSLEENCYNLRPCKATIQAPSGQHTLQNTSHSKTKTNSGGMPFMSSWSRKFTWKRDYINMFFRCIENIL